MAVSKKRSTKKKTTSSKKNKQKKEQAALIKVGVQFGVVLLLLISVFQLGIIGKGIYRFTTYFIGIMTIPTLLGLALFIVYSFLTRKNNLPRRYLLGGLFFYCGILLFMGINVVKPNPVWSGLENLFPQFFHVLTGEYAPGAGILGYALLGIIGTLFGYAGAWIFTIVFVLLGIVCMAFDWFNEKVENREPVEISKPDLSKVKSKMQRAPKPEPVVQPVMDPFSFMGEDLQDNGSIFIEAKDVMSSDMEYEKPKSSSLFIDVDEPTQEIKKINVEFGIVADEPNPKRKKRKIESSIFLDAEPEVEKDDIPFTLLSEEEKKPSMPKKRVEKKKKEVAEPEKSPQHYVHVADENWANYKLPKLNILDKVTGSGKNNKNSMNSSKQGERLIAILKQFGVEAKLLQIHIGPSVTKFEIKPELGVRVSKISGLQDDIKMALAATDIRIEAPIPGKNAIGVEIPNVEKTTVQMMDLMKNIPSSFDDKKLLFCIGKDLMGSSCYGELNKMPHLLIAGATGSGKSVCVNSIICSILMRTKPNEVKLILVDPKKVEFTPYNGVPHLLAPVITDGEEANKALKVVVTMMDKRYDMFSEIGVRNIAGYNKYVKAHPEENLRPMTSIVVIIDELADLMLVAAKEVEASIQRITQLARAAGIHLIVATQRPSVDVITGVIKANIPSRIAFAVSSQTDSRTILDQAGADRLLGYGDMLYLPNGETSPKRIQGVFITDEEVNRICDFVKSQGQPRYDDAFIQLRDLAMQGGEVKPENADPLYPEVKNFVIQSRKASTSLIQRRFSVGYSRAARLIDVLECEGVIGPANGSKPREILIGPANLEGMD
ncbi:MAG: DNA translocase FtsK [Bacillota bacterium]|nr:DNA translocase FtsK [Bacillota bacterium]